MADPIVEAQGLTKRFGKTQALDGLDLVAETGEVTAVLGPNGAGKTTFVRAVATLIRPDTGALRVGGVDAVTKPAQVRRLIGLAGQYAAVEEAMTGRENLEMVARLFGQDRATARRNTDRVLDVLRLSDVGDRLVRSYSGGLRRRLDLGRASLGHPSCSCSTSPPPASTRAAATRVGCHPLPRRRWHRRASHDAVKTQTGRDVVEVQAHHAADLPQLVEALAPLGSGPPRVNTSGRRVAVPVTGGSSVLTQAIRVLDDLEAPVDDIALRRPTLDEVFLKLTGSPIDGDGDGDGAQDHPNGVALRCRSPWRIRTGRGGCPEGRVHR